MRVSVIYIYICIFVNLLITVNEGNFNRVYILYIHCIYAMYVCVCVYIYIHIMLQKNPTELFNQANSILFHVLELA